MEFVPLWAVLDVLANNIPVPRDVAAVPDFAEAWKYSKAAAELHQQLLNSPERRPRWAANHNVTRMPVFDVAVADEGLSQLEHMAGWYGRKIRARTEHVIGCTKAGLDPDKEPPMVRPNDGMYVMTKLLRGQQIGFDKTELVSFLNNQRTADQGPPQPIPRQRAHEDVILLKLKELDYNPLALPRPLKGKKSPAKQAVKAALQYSDEVFRKAWQRLRNTGRIKDK